MAVHGRWSSDPGRFLFGSLWLPPTSYRLPATAYQLNKAESEGRTVLVTGGRRGWAGRGRNVIAAGARAAFSTSTKRKGEPKSQGGTVLRRPRALREGRCKRVRRVKAPSTRNESSVSSKEGVNARGFGRRTGRGEKVCCPRAFHARHPVNLMDVKVIASRRGKGPQAPNAGGERGASSTRLGRGLKGSSDKRYSAPRRHRG